MATIRYMRSSSMNEFRRNRPLTDDEIQANAPAIFANDAHDRVGSRYRFIETAAVLNGMRGEGFEPFEVRQTRVRLADRTEAAKHLIRFRHASVEARSGHAPEIVLLNSHDGTSSYRLMAGIFRFVCSNGLICGEMHADEKVRHSGDVVSKVIEASYRVLDDTQQVIEHVDEFRGVQLTDREQHAFATAALETRWDRDAAPVQPDQIMLPRRHEDAGADLWSAFNRAQENLVRGGLPGRTSTNRRTRTRGISGVDQNVRVNRALWTLAELMADLKAA